MKVLHVTGAMNMGGAEVMLMDLLRFKSENLHFDFLVNYNTKSGKLTGDFDAEIEEKGSSIEYIGAQWDIGPFAYIKKFKEVFKRLCSPEIVHIHMNAKSGVMALAAYRAGARKIIVHSHADLKIRGHWAKVFFSKLELRFQKWLIAKYATHFWGCSVEANRSLFYPRLLDNKRSAVINNAIDAERFTSPDGDVVEELKASYNLPKNTLVLGNVGRVVRHKNIIFILKILEEYKSQGKEVAFVFAGRGADEVYLTEFWAEAKDRGVDDKIVHLGVRYDIENVMATFDVFVGPALQEGFGLVALEAQAAGLPSVLYKGFPSSVDMGENMIEFMDDFDVNNWTVAVNAISRKRCNNSMINTIRKKGFDVKHNAQKIELLYES